MKARWTLVVTALLAFHCIGSSFALGYAVPFVARPPYSPQVGNLVVPVDLANKPRHFDFGGVAPFINPNTGVADIATINVWDMHRQQATVLNSNRIPNDGVVGRVYKIDGLTAIGYVRGDGLVEGKLRAQLNSYPIPARKHMVWELEFKLGAATPNSPWVMSRRGMAPATLWQLKTNDLPPALVMAVDTDTDDENKLEFVFDSKLDPTKPAVRLGTIRGIDPGIENRVRIETYLDDRPIKEGGLGFVRIAFNEKMVVDRWMPVLQMTAKHPYHWSLAMYLYSNTTPLEFDRFVYYRQAKMLVVE